MNSVTLGAPLNLILRLGQGVLSGRRAPGPSLLNQLLQVQPHGPDLQPLADNLLARCAEAFHSSRGALLFPKEASGFSSIRYLERTVSTVHTRLPGGQSMPGWLASRPNPLPAPAFEALPQWREMPSDSRGLLKEMNAAVYGPIVFSHGMAALLALGPRRNTRPYNHRDLALFETACRVFSMKLDTAWLCRQLQLQAEALSVAEEGALLTTRMATLGQMVAEVAHEVANSLLALNALTALLARQPSIESTSRHLQVADEEITRTGNMLRELLSFARPSAPAGQVVDLQGLMDSVLKLASIHPSSGNVTIDLACQVWRPKVNASEEQLKQVFYNLVRNG